MYDLYVILKKKMKINFSILSINAWSARKDDCLKKIIETCDQYEIDIVCMQESPPQKKLIDFTNYDLVFWGGHQPGDYLAILQRKKSDWRVQSTITVNTKLCETKRIGVSCKLNHPMFKDDIYISNIHLCGGGPDEYKASKNTNENLKDMKIETLKLLFDKSHSSMIIGDYNSDLNHFHTDKANPLHVEYLKKKGWSDSKIEIWNLSPFQFLEKLGFKYVYDAENEKDKLKSTSFSGTTPDAIWYDPNIWKIKSYTTIDFMKGENLYSDHNGLVVVAQLNY